MHEKNRCLNCNKETKNKKFCSHSCNTSNLNRTFKKTVTIHHCQKLAEDKGGKFLSELYIDARTKYTWQCTNGHQWTARYQDIKSGTWCALCGVENKRNSIVKYHNLAKKHNGKFFSSCDKINNKSKVKWECLLGHQWKANYNNVQQGHWCPICAIQKRKETNLKLYGVEAPSQNNEIGLKCSQNSRRSFILFHWKTNEKLVCIGSYERKVVEYLNQHKIEYEWQPKTFKTSIAGKFNYKTYRPDMYLIDENKWVEIKGYFRGNSKEKWDWFHEEYTNSELWDKKKLEQMKIL